MASVMITQRRKRSTTLAIVERLWLHQNRKGLFFYWFSRVLRQPCPQTEKETTLKEATVRLFPMPAICVTDSLPLASPSLTRLRDRWHPPACQHEHDISDGMVPECKDPNKVFQHLWSRSVFLRSISATVSLSQIKYILLKKSLRPHFHGKF